jgi:HEAT repeat protein
MPESVGVFTTDRDLVVQVWDATIEAFTGIEAVAAAGRPLQSLVPDLESRGLLRHFRRVLEEGVVEVLAPTFHHYLIPCPPQESSDRFSRMRQHVTIAPLEENGRVAGILVTIRDVTARLSRERESVERLKRTVPDSDVILDALDDEHWRVRESAVQAMTRHAAPDAIAALLRSVQTNHRNFGLLNSALKILRFINVDVHTALVDFLHDRDEDLRIQAALALGDQQDTCAIPVLVAALNDPSPNVVYHAIEALAKLRAQEAAETLVRIAESRDFFLGFPALAALAEVGNPSLASRLLPLLQDPMLREPTAQTLGRIGDESVVEPLVGVLNTREAPTVIIANSLASLYDRFEEAHGEGRFIAELAVQSIRAEGMQNVVDAFNGVSAANLRPLVLIVGWLRNPAAARAVAQHLGSAEVQGDVIEALVRHGHSVVDLLIEQLKSEDIGVRTSAVSALGRIRDKRATPALTALLPRDRELTIPLLGALTSIGDPAAVDSIFGLLATPDAAVRRGVVSALSALGSTEMVYRVMPLLDDGNPGVREAAVRISGYFGYPQCVNSLFERCGDADENVRRAAIEHIAHLEDPRTPDTLAQALRGDVSTVRATAAAALAHVDSSRSVPHLIAALEDSDPWVRYFTARSLDRHEAAEAAGSLARVAESDPYPQVRIAALEALSKIDGERAMSVARSFMTSADADLRHAADVILSSRNGNL